jgi:type IX secretion system PorP/SprF family membrane protein
MKRIVLIVGCTLVGGYVSAQTQYFAHRQWDNPSAMGEEVRTSVAVLGQYRLYGFEGAPMTAAMQVTIPFNVGNAMSARSTGSYYNDGAYSRSGTYSTDDDERKNMFVGVALQGVKQGAYRGYNAMLSYAYQIGLSASALAFGLSVGAKMDVKNYNSLVNDYDPDPQTNLAGTMTYAFATQAGIYWHNAKTYVSLYLPAITDGDVFFETGYRTTFGASDDAAYDSPTKKSEWAIHARAGYRVPEAKWTMQGSTLFTFKGLLGIGVAVETPLNVAALATLNIGKIRIGYAYQLYNLNEHLVQHEITIKMGFAKRRELQ